MRHRPGTGIRASSSMTVMDALAFVYFTIREGGGGERNINTCITIPFVHLSSFRSRQISRSTHFVHVPRKSPVIVNKVRTSEVNKWNNFPSQWVGFKIFLASFFGPYDKFEHFIPSWLENRDKIRIWAPNTTETQPHSGCKTQDKGDSRNCGL